MNDLPAPAMEDAATAGRRPPPHFVPVEAPPCGQEIDGPSLGGISPRFVCDRIRGHTDDEHRMVVMPEEGVSVTWTEEWTQLHTADGPLPRARR